MHVIQPLTWWRALPWTERVPLVLAALALLVGVALRPTLALASVEFALHLSCPVPQLAPARALDPGPVSAERGVVHEELLDAWGRPWRYERHTQGFVRVLLYSMGPDGQDDQGRGDDVRMIDGPLFAILAAAPWIGAGGALLVLWAWFVVGAARAPRARAVWLEAWRALVLVSPLSIVFLCVGALLGQAVARRGVESPWMLVSPATAGAGTFVLVLWLGGLALRLRRPPAEDVDAPLLWRRPVFIALFALLTVVLTAAWAWRDHERSERRRLLARACLGVGWPDVLLAVGDEDLIRAFLRRNSPLALAQGLPDYLAAELGRVGGVDAVPYLVRTLGRDPSGPVDFHIERSAAWAQVRAHDLRLEALLAATAKDPQAYRGLLLVKPGVFASRFGRRSALSALAQSVHDTRPVGATQGQHAVRACDHAAFAVTLLFSTSLPYRWPEPPPDEKSIDTRYWDSGVHRTREWLATEPRLSPVGWIVVDVRGASVVGGASRVAVQGAGLTDTFDAPGGDHLLVGRPFEAPRVETVKVTDVAVAGRTSTVTVEVRPGETTWLIFDLTRGTTQTHSHPVPP